MRIQDALNFADDEVLENLDERETAKIADCCGDEAGDDCFNCLTHLEMLALVAEVKRLRDQLSVLRRLLIRVGFVPREDRP